MSLLDQYTVSNENGDDFVEPKEGEGVSVAEAVMPDEEAQAGEVVGEVAVLQNEGDSVAKDMESLENAKATMESMYSHMVEAQKNGGLNPQAAGAMRVACESFSGIIGNSGIVPSVESFGRSASRERSTTFAMEGFKETIQRIWEAVKAAFKRLLNIVKDVMAKITFAAQRVRDNAKKIESATANLRSVTPKGDLSIGGQSLLFVNGKYDQNGAANVGAVVNMFATVWPKAVGGYISGMVAASKLVKEDSKRVIAAMMTSASRLPSFGGVISAKDAPFDVKDDAVVRASKAVGGNRVVYLVQPGKSVENGDLDAAAKAFASSVALRLEKAPQLADAPKEFKLPVPNAAAISTNMAHVRKAAEALIKASDSNKEIQTELNKVLSASAPDVDDAKGGDEAKAVRAVSAALQASSKLVGSQMSGTYSHMLQLLNAQVSLAKRQLVALKKGDGKAEGVAAGKGVSNV